MSTYQSLMNAISFAETVGKTFRDVSSLQADTVLANGQQIPTLAKRITDHLTALIPDLIGDEGVSVVDVYITDRDMYIEYDDGEVDVFTNVVPKDAISVMDFSINTDGDLVQLLSDTTDTPVGQIIPDEARGIENFEVLDSGDITITYTDGTTEDFGNIKSFGLPPIKKSEIINNDLFITLADNTTIPLGNVEGEIGIDGTEFAKVTQVRTGTEEVYFDFENQDGSTFRVGPAVIDKRIADPEDVLRKDYDDVSGDLILYPAGIPSISLGSMHGIDAIDGDDGITVNSIKMNSDGTKVVARMSDGNTVNFTGVPNEVIIPAGDTEIISHNITDNDELVFELGIPDSTPVKVNVGRVRGDDGITISSININSDGDIEQTIDNNGRTKTQVIGNVAYESIEKAEVLPTRDLVFTTTKGNTIVSSGSPDGDDGEAGAFIQDVIYDTSNEGSVTVELTDSQVFTDIGKARPLQPHDVIRDGSDNIIFNYADGSNDNIGVIDGVDAKNVSSSTVNTDNTITVDFDDGSSISSTESLFDMPNTIAYNESQSRIYFYYDNFNRRVSFTKPSDAVDGVWAVKMFEIGTGYYAGRARVEYSDGSVRTLPGGVIHGEWPIEINLENIDNNDTDIKLKMKWEDDSTVDYGNITKFYGLHGDVVTNAYYDTDGSMVFEWNKDSITDTVIPNITPVWVEDVYLDGDNFMIQYGHIEDPQKLSTVDGFNGYDGVWPVEMRINSLTDEAVIEYSDGTTEGIGKIDGEEGNWYTDIFRNENKELVVTNRFGNDVVVGDFSHLDGIEPRWITETDIDADRNLVVKYNDEDTFSVVGMIDGADRVVPESMLIDSNRDLIITDINGTTDNIGPVDGTDGVILEDITIDTNREVVIDYSDRSESLGTIDGEHGKVLIDLRIDTAGVLTAEYYGSYPDDTFLDMHGDDGKVMVNLFRDSNGDLISSYYDNTTYPDENHGNIDGEDYTTQIEDIREVDGKIEVESTGPIIGETEVVVRRLVDSTITSDVLSFDTNYTVNPIEVGYIAGEDYPDGLYITKLYVENQEMIADYSDGTTAVVAPINRIDFKSGDLINGLDNENENLQITLSDSSTIDLGRVKGVGESINVVDGLINFDGQIVLTFSNDEVYRSTSRIRGDDAPNMVSSVITEEGILTFNFDDNSTMPAGFVLQDLGFAPFDFTRTYDRGESATNDGNIYVSLNDGVASEPTPENSQWARVRLEGDENNPDASRPELISPINDEIHEFKQPYLLAGDLRNYYSVDTRGTRIYQIDLAENNFINPIYDAEENLNGHQVNMDLAVGTEYKWRCRDVVKETGYITDWSLEGYFTVLENVINRPVVTIDPSFDIAATTSMPVFNGSTYSGTGTHSESTWQVKRNSDDTIVYDSTNNELTQTMIPFGILFESTDYSVRVKYHNGADESPFSDWLSFTTDIKFNFNFKPVIEYVGDDVNATIAKPFFKATSIVSEFYDYFMSNDNLSAIWEVSNATDGVVWTTDNMYDIINVQVNQSIKSGVLHTIRVKYYSDRFFTDSEWSDSVTFTPDWEIAKPTTSTPYDITTYPVDGLFESSAFSGRKEEHYGSLWEIRDITTDEVMYSSNKSFEDLVEWQVSFGERDSLKEYYMVMKHLGRYGESEWSDPLTFTLQEIIEVSVYIASEDTTVRRLYNDGAIAWLNDDHTAAVHDVAVDFLRNAYSVGYDKVLRKVNEFGVEQWTYTDTNNLESVTVDDEYNVYAGSVTGEIIKFDENGNELWRIQPHTSAVRSLAIGSERYVYSGSADNTVKKIDGDGNVVWNFTGHTDQITEIDVDVNGYVYSASYDDTVRKISPRGLQEWSFTGHTNNVNGVAVNTNFNVFTASTDGTVKMLDSTGTEQWSTDFGITMRSIDTDYIDRSYTCANDGGVYKVYMLSDTGTVTWTYSQNTDNINTVRTNEVPVLMKPIDVTGRYYNLVAPENLVAF